MCMGRSVCVGGGGYTHMCMDVRAACMCLWDGVGVHAHVFGPETPPDLGTIAFGLSVIIIIMCTCVCAI